MAQEAEKVPDTDVAVCDVTCHEKFAHELGDRPATVFDDQVPSSDGVETPGVGELVDVVGPTGDDDRSTPEQPQTNASAVARIAP